MSGSSFKTATAAAFIKSNARLSFGFSKSYFDDNLQINLDSMSQVYQKFVSGCVLTCGSRGHRHEQPNTYEAVIAETPQMISRIRTYWYEI